MTLLIHQKDLSELQELLLATALYFELVGETEAAEIIGEQFDKLYNYDNSHNNIHNALNFDWDES